MKSRFLAFALAMGIFGTTALLSYAQEPIIREVAPGRRVNSNTKPATAPKPATIPKPAPTPRPRPSFVAPRLLWKTFLRRVDGSPATASNGVYIGAGNYLHQLDSGGRTLWATETGAQQSSPALDDTRVFIGSDKGTVYGMNRKTGAILWRFPAASAVQTRLSTGNGRVFVESSDNNVYALDAATGGLKWKFTRPDGSLGYSAPVFDKGTVYVAGETTLYRLNGETGIEEWRAIIGGKSVSAPFVVTPTIPTAGRVYVGSDGAGLTALSVSDGATAWNFRGAVATDWFGPPLVANDTVYVSTYNRYVYAVDAQTGKQKWQSRLLGNALSQPALDSKRGVLYVASATFRDNPTLTAFNARTGTKLWDFRMGYVFGSPQIVDDRLYIGSTTGFFYCFELGQ
jgi:outer membrane protein assembly factor BamB